jgi:monofunctional glycosyltransferase
MDRRAASMRRGWRWGRIFLRLALVALLLPAIAVALYALINPPLTPLMAIRSAQGHGLEQQWMPLDRISPALVRAVITAEDQKFCRHAGFDTEALGEQWQAWREGGRTRGASTITMQTAKNLFLWPGRDIVRKGIEAYITVWLELLWSKQRVMENYLNIVEFGPGVYGAEAAARRFFGKPASALTAGEAARLAAVLPNPRVYSAAQPSAYVVERSAIIRLRMGGVSTGCIRTGRV